jgi:ribosomal protein S18 acetylase RimI-like enzyme
MTLEFRQMTVEDVPATFSVRTSTVENAITMERLESDYAITPQSLTDSMGRDVKGWVCTDSGTVVGFAMGNHTTAEVLVVAVRPEYEGRGIGKKVLASVRDWLFDAGHEEIWLLATPDPRLRAYGFYHSLGWRGTGKIVRDDEIMILRAAN